MTNSPKTIFQSKKLNFQVRKAQLSDINEIGNVHFHAWKTTYHGIIAQDFLDNLELAERIASAKRRLESPTSNCFVCVETNLNKVVGFADFGKCREKNVDADGELYAIYFYQEFQNFGGGKMLFNYCFNQMKQLKFKKVMVSLFDKNNATKIFYEKMGGLAIKGDHVDIEGIRYPTATYIWNLDSVKKGENENS
jgi:L-amino acid N-acyltransferase YncA